MARPLRLAGAAAAFLSLWMPWYAIHLPESFTSALGTQTGAPPALAAFTQGLLSALPKHANGWQAMGGGDVAIAFLAGGLALLSFATADRSISVVGALAMVGIVAVHIVSPPGPEGFLVPASGAWVGLIGAGVVLASTFMSDAVPAEAPEPVWAVPPS